MHSSAHAGSSVQLATATTVPAHRLSVLSSCRISGTAPSIRTACPRQSMRSPRSLRRNGVPPPQSMYLRRRAAGVRWPAGEHSHSPEVVLLVRRVRAGQARSRHTNMRQRAQPASQTHMSGSHKHPSRSNTTARGSPRFGAAITLGAARCPARIADADEQAATRDQAIAQLRPDPTIDRGKTNRVRGRRWRTGAAPSLPVTVGGDLPVF